MQIGDRQAQARMARAWKPADQAQQERGAAAEHHENAAGSDDERQRQARVIGREEGQCCQG